MLKNLDSIYNIQPLNIVLLLKNNYDHIISNNYNFSHRQPYIHAFLSQLSIQFITKKIQSSLLSFITI